MIQIKSISKTHLFNFQGKGFKWDQENRVTAERELFYWHQILTHLQWDQAWEKKKDFNNS